MKLIVSDTTSLVVLEELGMLGLPCQIFEGVLLPQAVLQELQAGSPNVANQLEQAGCFEIVELAPSERLMNLLLVLDRGEAEAIALAVERQLPILLDERKGRSVALGLHLVVTGFCGLLTLAVRKTILPPLRAQSLLDQAIANGFRLSDKLYGQVSSIFSNL
jgi:predicted nucleic acid-binding protein